MCASCGELHTDGERLTVLEFAQIGTPLIPTVGQVEKVSRGLYTKDLITGGVVHATSDPQPCQAIEDFQKDLTHNHEGLEGLLLSKKGLYHEDDDGAIVHVGSDDVPEIVAVCPTCHPKLKRDQRPILSAANHQWVAPQPKALADLTWLERLLVSMVRHRVSA